MDRSNIIAGGRQLSKKESRNLNEGSEDNILELGGDIATFQTPFQQDNKANQFQFGREFHRFVLNRLHEYQKLAYKLRALNQSAEERVEKGIKEAKISILNIENLAKSHLSSRIKNLNVFVRGEGLENLSSLSPTYFESIQNINLIITGNFDEQWFNLIIKMRLIFQNLNVVNKSNLNVLRIQGNCEVIFQDCTFSGLTITCHEVTKVLVENSRFTNAELCGFNCYHCNSLIMDQIVIKDCKQHGCYVYHCENMSIDNIQVACCGECGIYFEFVNDFKLQNAFVQDCDQAGIDVGFKSVGEIIYARVEGCTGQGIHVGLNSLVRYKKNKCYKNDGGEFFVEQGSQYLRIN